MQEAAGWAARTGKSSEPLPELQNHQQLLCGSEEMRGEGRVR